MSTSYLVSCDSISLPDYKILDEESRILEDPFCALSITHNRHHPRCTRADETLFPIHSQNFLCEACTSSVLSLLVCLSSSSNVYLLFFRVLRLTRPRSILSSRDSHPTLPVSAFEPFVLKLHGVCTLCSVYNTSTFKERTSSYSISLQFTPSSSKSFATHANSSLPVSTSRPITRFASWNSHLRACNLLVHTHTHTYMPV